MNSIVESSRRGALVGAAVGSALGAVVGIHQGGHNCYPAKIPLWTKAAFGDFAFCTTKCFVEETVFFAVCGAAIGGAVGATAKSVQLLASRGFVPPSLKGPLSHLYKYIVN